MLETTPVKKKKAAHQAQQPQKPFLKFPEVPYKTNGDSFSEQQQQQSLHKVAARDQTHLRSPVLMHSPRMSRSVRSTNSDLDHETLSFFSSPLPDAGRKWSSLSTSTGSSGNTGSAGTEVVATGDKAKKALKKRITVKRKPVSDPSMSAATASSQIMFSPEDYGTEPPLTPVSPLVLPEEADRLDETTYAPQPVFLKNSTRAPLPTTAAELVDPGLSRYAGEGQWNVTHEISNENPTKTLVGDRPYSAYTCSTAPLVMTKTTTPVVATTTATTAAAAAAGGGGGFNRRSSTVRRKPRVPPKVPIGMSPEEFIAMEYAVYDKTEEDDRLRYINPV